MFSMNRLHCIEIIGISLCSGIFLISCGGGGGGGSASSATNPTAALTSGNAVQVSSEVLAAASIVSQSAQGTTEGFIGAVATDQARDMGIVDLITWQVQKTWGHEAELAPDQQVVGVVQNASMNCDFGGTMTGTWSDADNDGAMSAGDSFSFTFNNCGMGAGGSIGTMSGGMSMHFNSISGDMVNSGSFDVSVTLNNMVMVLPGDTETARGDMRVSMNFSGTATSFTATGTSLTYRDNGNVSRTLANYSMTSSTPDAMQTWSNSFNGDLTCPQTLGGTVSFQTTVPFSGSTTDYAHSGELEVTGVKPAGGQFNSSLYMTVLSNTEVQLDIDADGDGTYEDTQVAGWAQFTL